MKNTFEDIEILLTFKSVALINEASLLAKKATAAPTSLISPNLEHFIFKLSINNAMVVLDFYDFPSHLLQMWNFPQIGSHLSLPPTAAWKFNILYISFNCFDTDEVAVLDSTDFVRRDGNQRNDGLGYIGFLFLSQVSS